VLLTFLSFGAKAQLPPSANGKVASVNGVKIYYEESGTGVPLILLHHFFGTASQWHPYIPELSKKYRVINVDLPGHGRSDYMDTTNIYLHQKAAEYIIGLMDHLKLDSVYLMGASSGGFTGLYIATVRPERVKRLIVMGGQVYYSDQTRQIIKQCCGGPPDKEAISTHGQLKANLLQKQFFHFRQLYGDPSFTPDVLATVKAKSLIIHGDNDDIAPLFNALEMHKAIPGAHLWVVPHGGHIPSYDKKGEADFLRRITEFLGGEWDK
jgi:pimeloyl-ACP methyl ester carboxylesterase